MALVVISEYVYSEQNSTGYYWSRIISNLSNSNEKVIVITPREHEFEKESNFGDNVELKLTAKPTIKNSGTVSKIIYQLIITLKLILLVIKQTKKDDVVLSGTNPPSLLLAIALIKKFKKFKWQLLVHDVFPENFVPAGIVKSDSLIYRLLKWGFDKAYSSADELSVIGRDMEELMRAKTKKCQNVTYIPNWINTEEVLPVDVSNSRYAELIHDSEEVVFQFFGNIGRLQGIDNLLEAIKLVKNDHAKFIFLGRGPYVKDLNAFISENPELKIQYCGEVTTKDRNMALSSCHVALVTLEKGMFGLGVPSKSYFSMAADKPLLVVSDAGSEIATMVDEFNVGWNCETASPVALASLIDQICEEKLYLSVDSPRKTLINNYSEDLCLKKFFELTDRLTVS